MYIKCEKYVIRCRNIVFNLIEEYFDGFGRSRYFKDGIGFIWCKNSRWSFKWF